MAEFKKLSDVEVVAEPTETANVLIEEDGVIKKAPKTAVGGAGGGFIMRPASSELTISGATCTCTTNYDDLAKALEAGTPVTICMPAATLGNDFAITVLSWGYGSGTLTCYGVLGTSIGTFKLTNGTYVPSII